MTKPNQSAQHSKVEMANLACRNAVLGEFAKRRAPIKNIIVNMKAGNYFAGPYYEYAQRILTWGLLLATRLSWSTVVVQKIALHRFFATREKVAIAGPT